MRVKIAMLEAKKRITYTDEPDKFDHRTQPQAGSETEDSSAALDQPDGMLDTPEEPDEASLQYGRLEPEPELEPADTPLPAATEDELGDDRQICGESTHAAEQESDVDNIQQEDEKVSAFFNSISVGGGMGASRFAPTATEAAASQSSALPRNPARPDNMPIAPETSQRRLNADMMDKIRRGGHGGGTLRMDLAAYQVSQRFHR